MPSSYTAKIPVYNSLKACKGTMFFLPLPFNKTLETLEEVEHLNTALPEPELYIIVNGRPTKGQVVWLSLVNVDLVKTAIKTLKEINWLYKDVDVESVDEAAKRVIEVTDSASSTMLQKASTDDIAGFQAYTIRSLDNKLWKESDVEQYKVLSIKEDPLDNCEKCLDVMCFPVLFPTRQFGEHHPRQVKLSHSEYVKSRLLNKDSRYRKDLSFSFSGRRKCVRFWQVCTTCRNLPEDGPCWSSRCCMGWQLATNTSKPICAPCFSRYAVQSSAGLRDRASSGA